MLGIYIGIEIRRTVIPYLQNTQNIVIKLSRKMELIGFDMYEVKKEEKEEHSQSHAGAISV